MKTCSEHPGCLVVFTTDTTCPVCQQMAFVRDFQDKLATVEKDVNEMRAKGNREISDMTQELMAYVGRPRI